MKRRDLLRSMIDPLCKPNRMPLHRLVVVSPLSDPRPPGGRGFLFVAEAVSRIV